MNESDIVRIVNASSEDAKSIVRIKRDAWLSSYVNEESGMTEELIKKRFQLDSFDDAVERRKKQIKNINSKTEQIFVAKINDEVVGFTAPKIKDEQRRVGALYVSPHHQGKGVGKKLLEKAINWHNGREIFVQVVCFNQNAKNLYEKYGFVETGKIIESKINKKYCWREPKKIEMVFNKK